MRVAVTNLRPAWLQPAETTKLVVRTLEDAAARDVRLITFGETLLPGYPMWANWTDTSDLRNRAAADAYARYLAAAVDLDGPEVREVATACVDLGLFCYLGIAERHHGSTFATLVAISPERGIVGAHRKLRPTYAERLVWSPGDGNGLRCHDLDGWRVGGLNCWENWMPQARAALYADGEMLHVAAWPGARRLTKDITRFTAMEGRVFALASGGVMDATSVPDDFPLRDQLLDALEAGGFDYDGGAAIAGPDGAWVLEPTGEEGIHVADLDLDAVRRARSNFDPAGHYSRPDVFRVEVDRRRQVAADFID